jgi:D-alanyl-D-alanine carboxypeptidase/D-alanyl-D-alanine-endopeptidase (penicillin-binding protein 4)
MRALRTCTGGLLLLCLVLGWAPAAEAAADPAAAALASLQRALAGDLRHARGQSSALVVDLSTGQTLFAAAPNAPRLPASLEKLYTTSTALLEYGPTATLETAVLGAGSLTPGGVWKGALYLRGGGDPTFGSASFDHAAYGTGASVQDLAAAVRAAGIQRVDGPIVGDGSLFDALRGTPATGWAPNTEVEGQLGGLIYDAGFTTPAETALQPRPALFATLAFVAALRAAGVHVPATVPILTGSAPSGATIVAAVNSPPMSTLIELTNAPSDNFFAETLLKDLGASFGAGGTTAAGAAVVQATVAATYNIHPRLDDGSGLSRFDRTTATQIVSLLRQQVDNEPFVDSLAVAGESGTMQHEMLGTPAVANCRGKTGTLSDVANLAGYCTARNGDLLAFAFLENGLGNATTGHEIEDAMGAQLAEYDPLTGAA